MKAAHQGVPIASLPNSQAGGSISTLAQIAAQISAPSAPTAQPPTPIPSGAANRPAPTRASTRPEAAAGLDGWLMERLFGR
jgi:penicillin-binding protein 1A